MFLRLLTLLFLCAAIAGCNKPDPNPELKDPIYNDLNARLASTNQALEAEKKALEGFEKELSEVIPQTGQIKYAQKRVYDSQAKIMKLGQEAKYLELKTKSRLQEAKQSYSVAFKKGEEWPKPEEATAYEAEKRLRAVKMSWDANARVKALAPGAGKVKAGGHGEGGGEEKAEGGEKKAEGGHH